MKTLIKSLGVVFGLSGTLHLTGFVSGVLNFPSEGAFPQQFPFVVNFFFFFLFLGAAIDFLILYSFWTLKRWAAYLAIVFCSLMLLQITLGFLAMHLAHFPLEGAAKPYLFPHLVLYLVTLAVCIRKDARDLMRN